MPDQPPASLKSRLKHLAFRTLRPGLQPVNDKLDDVQQRLQGLADRLDRLDLQAEKYDSELEYWRWLIKKGGSEKDFGAPFAQVFGVWQRNRLIKLGHFLGLAEIGHPGDVEDWASTRSVIEIGAGPYPAVAAASKGWKRCVAADPLARGYVEEDLVPDAASHVVYLACPGEQIPLPARFADLIIIENCLDHVAEPERVVREMWRLLRPGGYIWLFVDLSNHRDHMHPHAFNEQKVRALLKDFRVVSDIVSSHKAHPEAYGGYRGLLQKPEADGRIDALMLKGQVPLAQTLRTDGAGNGAHPEIHVNGRVDGSVPARP